MNREIKFRGKRLDNGEWVYGYYYATRNGTDDPIDIHRIVYDDGQDMRYAEVDPETVGQFIGLKDKKGNEIYEGDIITLSNNIDKSGAVEFKEGHFVNSASGWGLHTYLVMPKSHKVPEIEIIGNIHDNPELLTV